LLADPSGYIFAWLVGYSGGLGSIAGVLIADYWLVRNKRLALPDLYRTRGVYTYNGGWNWRAVVATLIGCGLAWIGLLAPPLRPLYDYGWFVGFGAAGLTHLLLMKVFPPQLSSEAKADAS
jgi:NCS1 family nucleobase:cation symporter-1